MASGLNTFLLVILLIVLVVTAYFMSSATRNLVVGSDSDQQRAENVLIVGATIAWTGLAFIILGAIFVRVFSSRVRGVGAKLKSKEINRAVKQVTDLAEDFIIDGILVIIILILFAEGILAAIAAGLIDQGANADDNDGPYAQAIIASVLAIISSVAVGGYLAYRLTKGGGVSI